MITLVTVIHIVTIVLMIAVILLQSGKGAEVSASFGGSSQTIFGTSGGTNFFQKFTYAAAAVFFVTSVSLTLMRSSGRKSVFDGQAAPSASPVASPITPTGSAPTTTTSDPSPGATAGTTGP